VSSSDPDVCDQARWFAGQGPKHTPALLSGRRQNRTDNGEVHRTILRAKSAGDLLTQFHHPPTALGQVVGEGDAGIGQEPEHVLLAGTQSPSGSYPLELQTFLSISLMDASLRNARALRVRFSKSFANRRHRLSQASVRSTTQRRGRTSNPLTVSERLTISTLS